MSKRIARKVSGFLAVLAISGLIGTMSTSASAQMQAEYRAGIDTMAVGQAGIFIKFKKNMPTDRYAISVQQVNDGKYSPVTECTYLNALKPTNSGFQIQHKTCNSDIPQKVTKNLQLRWIVIELTQ